MATPRFDQLYRRLVRAFRGHEDAPRTTETVSELGAARWELELARKAIAVERSHLENRVRSRPLPVRRASASDDEIARLRVLGVGYST